MPGSLSVAWRAASAAPTALVSGGGEIGLRLPGLSAEAFWLYEAMVLLALPLPTTSYELLRAGGVETVVIAAALRQVKSQKLCE